MFAKLISKIFPDSKETQVYTQLCNILREILLPLGFSESQDDIQASLSKRTVFQKETHQVILDYDMRERVYALLTPKNGTIYMLEYPGYNEESLNSARVAVEEWLRQVK
jgi:hypothetical protein